MTFASPVWLWSLALIPVAALVAFVARRRARRYAVRFPATGTLLQVVAPSWRRHVPAALVLAAMAALALALARPHAGYSQPVGQASVMLVTDHSGSMAATDVQPTRLAAAERAANTFINQLPGNVRLGAIAFSSAPDSVQAPVPDHAAARGVINSQTANGATDTGDALQLALQLLHYTTAKRPPSAIVLLSDGAANTGANASTVAREAGKARIPIYTVALGTPNGVLQSPDPFEPSVRVPPDPQLMAQIARLSGGRAFNARSADELSSIYKHLATQLGSVRRTREVTAFFAIGGLVLLVVAAATSLRRSALIP